MNNFLRSLVLVAVAGMSLTSLTANAEWHKNKMSTSDKSSQCSIDCPDCKGGVCGKGMQCKKGGKCSTECKEKFARLNEAIDKVKSPEDREELRHMLHMKHCMHHKLEWLDQHMCEKCKSNFEKYKQETCMKCEKCSAKNGRGHMKKMHKKHMHKEYTHKNKKAISE